jgi:hypothetical protein
MFTRVYCPRRKNIECETIHSYLSNIEAKNLYNYPITAIYKAISWWLNASTTLYWLNIHLQINSIILFYWCAVRCWKVTHWIVHISLWLQNWLARFGDRLPLRAPEVCRVRDVTQELHRIGNQLNTSPRAGNVQQRLSSFLQSSINRQDFVLKFQTVFHFKCQLLEKKVCINLQRFETLTDTTCD